MDAEMSLDEKKIPKKKKEHDDNKPIRDGMDAEDLIESLSSNDKLSKKKLGENRNIVIEGSEDE